MALKSWQLTITSGVCSLAFALVGTASENDDQISELRTLSGKIYRNVKIGKVTPLEVSIIHESGAARIAIADLSDDLKRHLGYDAANAEAYAKSVAQSQRKAADAEQKKALNQALLKAAEPRVFIVDRETPDGLLVTNVTAEFWEFLEMRNMTDLARSGGGNAASLEYDIIGNGGGVVVDPSYRGNHKFLLIGVPGKERFVEDSAVGGSS